MSRFAPGPRIDTRTAALIVVIAAAGLLAAVFAMQYSGEFAPCHLCLLQRWPHGAVILLGAAAFLPVVSESGRRVLLLLCAVAFSITGGIGGYHVGVEHSIFTGPTSCRGDITGATIEELRQKLMATPIIRCNEVTWSLFGISLAGYNLLVSTGLAIFSVIMGLRRLKNT